MKVFWQQCEGQVVDGFPLRKYLGGGDDQAVFLTEFAGDATRKAAIKLSHADPETTEAQLGRWRLAAELSHPNLMRLFERGTWQLNKVPLLYVVTEYADENLSEVIPERPLSAAEAKEMLTPALDALAYLHSKGFVHGHLKPSNFLAIDNGLKISSDRVVQSGAGTTTPPDDVWSLGMTLVEALTQRLPVWNPSDAREPVLPEKLPAEFREIAREALRRDPRSRWTVAAIQRHLRGEPTVPVEPAKSPKRSTAALAIPALFITFLAAVAGTLFLRNREAVPGAQTQTPPAQTQTAPTHPAPAPTAKPVPQPPPPQPESKPAPSSPANAAPTTAAPVPSRPAQEEVTKEVLPEMFPRARNSIHGKVIVDVRVNVDASGNVSGATVESPEASQYFRSIADKAARRWKFAAADVPRVWILRFEFARAGAKASARTAR